MSDLTWQRDKTPCSDCERKPWGLSAYNPTMPVLRHRTAQEQYDSIMTEFVMLAIMNIIYKQIRK